MKTIIKIILSILMIMSLVGCAAPATVQQLEFSSIYPLIMGKIPETQIFFKAGEGLVFYTKFLPSLNSQFSLFIPFTNSTNAVDPSSLIHDVELTGESWKAAGFDLVDGDQDVFVRFIRNGLGISAEMTWKAFAEAISRLRYAGSLIKPALFAAEYGTSLFTMPIVIVPVNNSSNPVMKWWHLDELYPDLFLIESSKN